MNNDHKFFCKLNIKSEVISQIKNKIQNSIESDWRDYLGLSIFYIDVNNLIADAKIVKLIKDIGDEGRIGIQRAIPNSCYDWHTDAYRFASINMLIDGFDSMCIFGNNMPYKKFTELSVIKHEPATYYLMNVSKFHTVYNFNNQRYILSLSIPKKSFEEVKEYLKENDMI